MTGLDVLIFLGSQIMVGSVVGWEVGKRLITKSMVNVHLLRRKI